jgi:hypothetical protein
MWLVSDRTEAFSAEPVETVCVLTRTHTFDVSDLGTVRSSEVKNDDLPDSQSLRAFRKNLPILQEVELRYSGKTGGQGARYEGMGALRGLRVPGLKSSGQRFQ